MDLDEHARGDGVVAASASALNQWIEQTRDARMERTANRPLPSGRIQNKQAIAFGAATLCLGMAELAVFVNLLTALLGGSDVGIVRRTVYAAQSENFGEYGGWRRGRGAAGVDWLGGGWGVVLVYRRAAAGRDVCGGAVFNCLFMAVSALHGDCLDLSRSIFRSRHANADGGRSDGTSGRDAGGVWCALALLPISLLPALQLPSPVYMIGAIVLGVAYLAAAALFCWKRNQRSARFLLQTSLVYLPVLLVLLVLSPWM